MTAVVLGGTGFLGRHVVDRLTAAGDAVVPLAGPGSALPGGAQPCPGTASDLTALLVAHRATVVVNAAGTVWLDDEQALHEANVALVERLCAAIAAVPWPVRVVQLGSVFEYAVPAPGQLVTEDTETRPTSSYGRSKLLASTAVLGATRAGRLDGVVLRATTCVGTGMPTASLFGRVVTELRDAAREGRPALLRVAPLTAHRDVLDARDLADAVLAATRAPVTGRVLTLGRGVAPPTRALVDLLISVSAVPVEVVEDQRARGRSAGIPWLAVSGALAARLLGWVPHREPRSTMQTMWSTALAMAEERA